MGLLGEPLPVAQDDPLATYHQDEYLRQLFITSQNLALTQRNGAINNNDKAGNLAGKYVVFTSNGVANTEDAVLHALGAVPTGYIIVRQNQSAILYTGSTAWTKTTIYLKSSAASTLWTVMVF
jgi:hypothetical protein